MRKAINKFPKKLKDPEIFSSMVLCANFFWKILDVLFFIKERDLSTSLFIEKWRTVSWEVYGFYRKCRIKHAASKCLLSIANHCCRMKIDLHLISSSGKYAGRGTAWSHFCARHWLNLIMLNNYFKDDPATFGMWSFSLTETKFHVSKCNVKEQLSILIFVSVAWSLLKKILFRFICSLQKYVCFYSIPNLWFKQAALAYTDEIVLQPSHVFPHRYK